jgi:hypothetical protein
MLGNGKLHVGGTGVGGDGTGTDGGLELTGGGLNTDPEAPATGPDEEVPDVCGEPGPEPGVVDVPGPPPVEGPLGVGPLAISDPLEEGDPATAEVPVEASAPDWLVVMGGATAPPQRAEARANASDATRRDGDRRHFMSSI